MQAEPAFGTLAANSAQHKAVKETEYCATCGEKFTLPIDGDFYAKKLQQTKLSFFKTSGFHDSSFYFLSRLLNFQMKALGKKDLKNAGKFTSQNFLNAINYGISSRAKLPRIV